MNSELPRVVAIGGGHGLASTLASLVDRCSRITAVVSVADDGGSSGRLRRDLAIPALGDMRRCLAALTPPGVTRDALMHRFEKGDLDGHAAGNIWLAALVESAGDVVSALDTAASMVEARGRVLPVTVGMVELLAHSAGGIVRGQVAVSSTSHIDRISFDPTDPPIPDAVRDEISRADAIVIGPGSLFTSVLATLVPGVVRAIDACQAKTIFVTNLDPEDLETPRYGIPEYLAAIGRHGLIPNVVLADGRLAEDAEEVVSPNTSVQCVIRCLASPNSTTHDPYALGVALSELITPVRA